MIAKQYRKLSSEVNPRDEERSLLARVDREVRLQLTADEAVALLEGLRCAREVLAMFQSSS